MSLGFEIYDPENLTFAEEVECFSNAEFIIGTIGGALTNCIYCNPRATVCIIMPNNLTDAIFNPELAQHIGFSTYIMDADVITDGWDVSTSKFYYPLEKCRKVAETLGIV